MDFDAALDATEPGRRNGGRCKFAQIVDELSEANQAKVATALENHKISAPHIVKALVVMGRPDVSASVVRQHRVETCSCVIRT